MYVIMLLVLVAIIGLTIDVGYMYVSYARLRRAVDAAALDASNQIKEGYTGQDLENAAEQFLRLNDVIDPSATVHFCNAAAGFEEYHDPSMCTTPPRKLVSVTATSQVPTFFMGVLGFNSMSISASAESEAASVDVILVIDISASQVEREGPGGGGEAREDPYWCNTVNLGDSGMPGGCMPFESVKNAAYSFVENGVYLDDPITGELGYDRVGIVTFSRFAESYLELTSDKEEILDSIEALGVDELEICPYPADALDDEVVMASLGSRCRAYTETPSAAPTEDNEGYYNDIFSGMQCPQLILANGDSGLSTAERDAYAALIPNCNNTNSGAGLLAARDMLLDETLFRDESTWVVIFLTDGGASLGYLETLYSTTGSLTPYCPDPAFATGHNCRDGAPLVRHNPLTQPLLYDADDYARDAMDNLFGNQVYLFTIGQGTRLNPDTGEAESRALVSYAEGHESKNGASYFGSTEAELREIFLKIANRISTRITR